jgi:GDPmannose 4,6-dehydratase
LAHYLRGLGYRVIGTVPDLPIPPGFVEAYLPEVDLRTVDLTDRGGMRAVIERERPDEIYNLASISSVAASWKTPLQVTEINGVAALGLLDVVREIRDATGYSPRICQASSSEIFGPSRQLPQAEDEPLAPTNPYGVAKALAHMSAATYRQGFGLFASSVILFNHESPLRPPSFVTRKVTSAAARIAGGDLGVLELGRRDIRRDWGAAADYVRAMHAALQADQPGDYVVATGQSRTLDEFVRAAFATAGVEPTDLVVTNPEFVRPTDVPETRGDPTRARTVLGWQPEIPFEALVAGMVRADLRRRDTGTEHHPDYLRMGLGADA